MNNKLQKFVVAVTTASMVLSSAPALAQTASTSSLQTLLQSLQAQVQALNAQLLAQQQAQSQVQSTIQGITGTLKLIAGLKQGATGDQVKLLQTILSSDPDIYPEGIVNGRFGALTAKAVKRFQKKHGLKQIGNVGPQTLSEINKEFDKNPVSEEKDEHGEDRKCAIVPPGHLIAPGWLRKHGGVRPIVPACQTLPPGILSQLNQTSTPTSTPPTSTSTDTTAPVISNVSSTSVASFITRITWITNEGATSNVYYSTTGPINILSPGTLNISSDALVQNHDLTIANLSTGATYYYIVSSRDAAGNSTTSAQFSFAAGQVADTIAPTIYAVGSSNVATSTAHVIWSTNESSTSKVWFGATSTVSANGTPNIDISNLVQSHDVALTGLTPNTTYYFVVGSADASGNLGTSSQYYFVTQALADTTPPTISGISSTNISSSSAHIVWTTNETATNKVWYNTATPVNTSTAQSVSASGLVLGHDLTMPGLNASTTYYYIVSSADAAGNTANSSEASFVTSGQ